MLFDEPLTVIDPHLKWQLRRKLKQIHHELKLTLIYVTHDQVEALTFAEQVVVMTRGRAVQIGSAAELFERPQHTFVGHFIGSPGMNFLPAEMARRAASIVGGRCASAATASQRCAGSARHARHAARIRDARERRHAGRVPAQVVAGAGHRHLLAASRRAIGGARRSRARLAPSAAGADGRRHVWLRCSGRTPAFTRTS